MLNEKFLIESNKKLFKYQRKIHDYNYLKTSNTRSIMGVIFNIASFFIFSFFIYFLLTPVDSTSLIVHNSIDFHHIFRVNIFTISFNFSFLVFYFYLLEMIFGHLKDENGNKNKNKDPYFDFLYGVWVIFLFGYIALINLFKFVLLSITNKNYFEHQLSYDLSFFQYFNIAISSIFFVLFIFSVVRQYCFYKKEKRFDKIYLKIEKNKKNINKKVLNSVENIDDYELFKAYCEEHHLNSILKNNDEEIKNKLLQKYNCDNFDKLKRKIILDKNNKKTLIKNS